MKNGKLFLLLFLFMLVCKQASRPAIASEEIQNDTITESIKTNTINYLNLDSIMNEKYDYEATHGGKQDVYIEKNGWIIRMISMGENGTFYDEYPPAPAFYEIQKRFYPNGNIKSAITYLGDRTIIGTSEYYDEDGRLVEEVNEDKKFGRIKPEHILAFLEKEGWIDRKTGKGRTEYKIVGTEVYSSKDCVFELDFEPVGESYFIKDNKVPIWVVTIPATGFTNNYETTYLIDGETGKVLKKEVKQILRIE